MLPIWNAIKVPSHRISGILSRIIIPLGHRLLGASSDQPAYSPNRVNACLFDLAPAGVCRTIDVTINVVGSYPTVSSLPSGLLRLRRFTFCCTFRRFGFLSKTYGAWPLTSCVFYGVPTFLAPSSGMGAR